MKFTSSALLAITATVAAFLPSVAANCHKPGDVCAKSVKIGTVACTCHTTNARVECKNTGNGYHWYSIANCPEGQTCNHRQCVAPADGDLLPEDEMSSPEDGPEDEA